MKRKRYTDIDKLGLDLGLSQGDVQIIKIKTKLKKRIIAECKKLTVTNTELAKTTGLSRSVVSGIINGNLQSVSLEGLIKFATALDMEVNITCKKVA